MNQWAELVKSLDKGYSQASGSINHKWGLVVEGGVIQAKATVVNKLKGGSPAYNTKFDDNHPSLPQCHTTTGWLREFSIRYLPVKKINRI